jgi:hypothetical protein
MYTGAVPANRTWGTDAYTLIYQHRTMTRDRAIAEALDALIEQATEKSLVLRHRAGQALLTATGEPADKIGCAAGDSRLAACSYWNGIPRSRRRLRAGSRGRRT